MSGVRLTRQYPASHGVTRVGPRGVHQQRIRPAHPEGHDRLRDDEDGTARDPRGLAKSVGGTGVTVNAVLPDPTSSEIFANWLEPVAREQGKSLEQVQ
jgi:hypothetical protein